MKVIRIILVMLLSNFSSRIMAAEKTIKLRADLWCPYNCDPEHPTKKGYLVELLLIVAKELGYRVDYQAMGWEDSLKAGRDGEIDAVVGLTIADAEGFELSTEALTFGQTCLYGKRNGPRDLDDGEALAVSDLGKMSIAVPRSYTFEGDFQKYLDDNQNDSQRITWVDSMWPLIDGYKLVFEGRVDLFPENRAVVDYLLASLGIRGGGQIKNLGCVSRDGIFIGFSKKNPDAKNLSEALTRKLQELKQSGEWTRILARYGLQSEVSN